MNYQHQIKDYGVGLRGCFRSSESLRNSFEHELNHGLVDEGLPSAWRLRPLTHLPPSKPRARWVRQPSGTDCVSAMATQGDWGACTGAAPTGAGRGECASNCPGRARVEVSIHSLPRWEVRRQHAPGAAGTQEVQNSLDHSPQVGLAGPPQRGIGGEVGCECRPLCLAQPRGVGWGSSFHGLFSFSSVRQPMPWKLPDF